MLSHDLSRLKNKAQALIITLMVIAVLVIISVALFSKAINERNLSLHSKLNNEVFYLAEGGVEDSIKTFRDAVANYLPTPGVVNTPFTNFPGNPIVNSVINDLFVDALGNPLPDNIITVAGLNMYVRNYQIDSTATHPQYPGINITLHQIIERRLIPIFQFGVFYNQDLEILPGPNMDFNGRIHSNQDIYLDAEGGSTLTIDSEYLRSAGNIFNMRRDNGTRLNGNVRIQVQGSPPGTYQYMDNGNTTITDSTFATWTTDADTLWNGTVQSSVHGVTELAVPEVSSIQPGGYYNSNANLVIVNGNITKNGVPLIQGVDCPVGTVTASTTFYNNREGQNIRMTDIDLRKLAGYAPGDPPGSPSFPYNLPANGLIYAADTLGGGQPGIRLIDGSQLYRAGGLTVVSNDPVYIQGNYNSTNKKPASVICDALNIISNNWNDANSRAGLGSRRATPTTVNCAFISGIVETVGGSYSGGLENYPRFHENWTGVNLYISGSFVNLGESLIATGAWFYGSPQYTAPTRFWSYDAAFNTAANLPPFTPMVVQVRRVVWYR